MKIGIVDYGCGNVASIKNILRYIGYDANLTRNVIDIENFDSIILPGVGHFQNGMEHINASGLRDALDLRASMNMPILGICLGMQLMTRGSDEAPDKEGLGWFGCQTKKIPNSIDGKRLLVPHIGWNYVDGDKKFFDKGDRFYFVHSYYVDAVGSSEELGRTEYNGYMLSSAIKKGALTGVQFHPEKSHQYGMQFFKKYLRSIGE